MHFIFISHFTESRVSLYKNKDLETISFLSLTHYSRKLVAIHWEIGKN